MMSSQSSGVNMKVAIAGYGVEGEENFKYWSKLGADVTIFDEAQETARPLPQGTQNILGEGVFSKMNGFDIVVRTASLNPDKIKTDGKIWSATNEFFKECPAPIIGVTGTKGKGTTCSLIAEILRESGKNVHLVGNIGVPALEVLPIIKPTDFVVFELSSFQLWDIERSPETAVILMIEPDHLNTHADMDDYVKAKSNIGKFQSEDNLMVYHPTNSLSQKAAEISRAKKVRYMTEEGAHIDKDSSINIGGNIICDISEVGLLGPHNLENICAAVSATWRYTQDIEAIKNAVMSFRGLPHRLEFVREIRGVKYYDDSCSSTPGATIAALKSFSEPLILILGGSDKGADMTELLNTLNGSTHAVALIGASSNKLEIELKNHGFNRLVNLGSLRSMGEIINKVSSMVHSEKVVLLSPAHASFDMFNSFYDRGDQFKEAVRSLQ